MQPAPPPVQPAQPVQATPNPAFDYLHFLHRLKECAFATFLAIIFIWSLARILYHELKLDVVFAKSPGVEERKVAACPSLK